MSHIVTLQTKVYDPVAIANACQRLGFAQPIRGTAELFSGQATGLLLQLPEWQYPAVIDTTSGVIHFDTYEGAWGDRAHLDRFLQRYAVENTYQSQCTSCEVSPTERWWS
jgi:hypothetical protein